MKKHGLRIAAVVIPGILLLAVFWDTVFSGKNLFSPDTAPFYGPDYRQWSFESLIGLWDPAVLGVGGGGLPFHPTKLLAMLFPPLVYHVLVYVVNVVLVGLAAAYYLRGRGLRGLAAYLPAIALGLSGYTFTLISAGHRTSFNMMPYAVFLFGLVDRMIEKRSWFHFALAGACVGFGLTEQPDVMGLFCLLAVGYAIYRLIQSAPREKGDIPGFLLKNAVGGVLALLFFGLVSLGPLVNLSQKVIPTRDRQIQQTKSMGNDSSPQQKWEFATDWSMPPEEILEFVAPCVYGIETGDRAGPYWGRLGRSLRWKSHKQGLFNLRQHTVYLGVIQLVFAFYALIVAWRRQKNFSLEADGCRPDIFFWGGAAILCLMLALGRYFPLYRFFFMLPYFSKIRAPVKFVHLLEVAVCFLFAFGLNIFFCDLKRIITQVSASREGDANGVVCSPSKKSHAQKAEEDLQECDEPDVTVPAYLRLFLASGSICLLLGVLMFVGAGVVRFAAESFYSYWRSIGMGFTSGVMMSRMLSALTHGGVLFLVAAGVFFAARTCSRKEWLKNSLVGVLVLTVCMDLILVDRLYIRVKDLTVYYARNPIAKIIRSDGELGRTSYYLSSRGKLNPLWVNFSLQGVDVLEPRDGSLLTDDYKQYFGRVAQKTVRLWQLTNTRFIMGPTEKLAQLMKHPSFEAIQYFDVTDGRVTSSVTGGVGANVLLRFKGALPRALVYYAWRSLDKQEDVLAELVSPQWDPTRSVLVSGSMEGRKSETSPSQASVVEYGRMRVAVEVHAKEDGLLLLNDKFDSDWRVHVDGVETELFPCNYLMRGVRISPGEHSVVFTYRPFLKPFIASMTGCLALLLWGIIRFVCTRRRSSGSKQVS